MTRSILTAAAALTTLAAVAAPAQAQAGTVFMASPGHVMAHAYGSRGSSEVEAGYTVLMNFRGDAGKDFAAADISAGAWGEAFSRSRTLFVVGASATTMEGQAPEFRTTVTVSGMRVYDQTDDALQLPAYGASFDKSKSYGWGPASISARVWIGGNVSGTVTGWMDDGVLTLVPAPSVTLGGGASASADLGCASAGIDGTVEALGLEVPIEVDLDVVESTVQADANLELDMLSGKIKLYADYCVGSKSKTLVEKSPWSYDHRLMSTQAYSL